MSVLRSVRSPLRILSVVIFLWSTLTAQQTAGFAGVDRNDHIDHIDHLYRVYGGSAEGFNVWIVDGKMVREALIPEFLYGGNPQIYPAIPHNEIWIDHAISCEEYTYTLRHELCEQELMAAHGWTYGAAHDSALRVEERLRLEDRRLALEHERRLHRVAPTDFYLEKELPRLGDSTALHDIYRVYAGKRESMDIWIVDGAAIRRDLYPDFGLSGNDLAYHFIPHGEIWLDAQISCEEMEFSIWFELAERKLMAGGLPYDDAYEKALMQIHGRRIELSDHAAKMHAIPLTAHHPW
jgi:hypothetical protein